MKLKLGILSILVNLALQQQAQTLQNKTYPVVISYNSQCCGVPSDSSLRTLIYSIRKQFHLKKIRADKIGPMGREGEYYVAFTLRELNKKQRKSFIAKIKKLKKLPDDPGTLTVNVPMKVEFTSLPSRVSVNVVEF